MQKQNERRIMDREQIDALMQKESISLGEAIDALLENNPQDFGREQLNELKFTREELGTILDETQNETVAQVIEDYLSKR